MDISKIALLAESDAEKAAIIHVFFRVADELIATMQSAIARGAYAQWKQAARSLKGSAASFGMHVLEEKCRQAEQAENSGVAKSRWLLENIRHELQHIREYIENHQPAWVEC